MDEEDVVFGTLVPFAMRQKGVSSSLSEVLLKSLVGVAGLSMARVAIHSLLSSSSLESYS